MSRHQPRRPDAPAHPIADHPPGTILHATLEQGDWWYDAHGRAHRISGMADLHVLAVIGLLERRADEFAKAERLLRLGEWLWGWDCVTMPDPRDHPGALTWLRATPLLRALRDDVARRAVARVTARRGSVGGDEPQKTDTGERRWRDDRRP